MEKIRKKGKIKIQGPASKNIKNKKIYMLDKEIKEDPIEKRRNQIISRKKEIKFFPRSKKYNFEQGNRATLIKLLNIYSRNSKTRKGKLLNWKLYM